MTKYGRPVSVVPASSTRAMFGWSIIASGLPLGLEAGDHLPRVHARLDDLERDRPLDRLGLLGHEHDAHAAFADLLQQLVGADERAGAFLNVLVVGQQGRCRRPLKKVAGPKMCRQQRIDTMPQLGIPAASALDVFPALLRRRKLDRGAKDLIDVG